MIATRYPRHGDGEGLARAIGWMSIGLGVAAIAAPRRVGRMIGVGDGAGRRDAILAVGLREIASGMGILSRRRPAGWLWARVGGDVMDLALLAGALASGQADRGRVSAATLAVAGIAALDVACARRLHRTRGMEAGRERPPQSGAVRVRKSVIVNRPPEELYAFWRDLANLPRIMGHLESVEVAGDGRSRWRAEGPAGTVVSWEAEITEDRPNQLLAWRSLPGGGVDTAGSVRFERVPGGRSTAVEVELHYLPPGGVLGAAVARLFDRDPGTEMQEDLRAFKRVMEAGEAARSPAGTSPPDPRLPER